MLQQTHGVGAKTALRQTIAVQAIFQLANRPFRHVAALHIKARRKNRIDVFYRDAIALRNSVDDSSPPYARKVAIGKVRELQTKAFDLLVHEKVAADESFRIFITLSNDIIDDLRRDPE